MQCDPFKISTLTLIKKEDRILFNRYVLLKYTGENQQKINATNFPRSPTPCAKGKRKNSDLQAFDQVCVVSKLPFIMRRS